MRISTDDLKAILAIAKTAPITAGEAQAVGELIARVELAVASAAIQDAVAQQAKPANPLAALAAALPPGLPMPPVATPPGA